MTTTACRFPSCSWTGPCDDLFPHCEAYHRNGIKYLIDGNRYDFTFEDLTHEAYLLCGKEGLYWFCLDTKATEEDPIKRGVFAIGDSETIKYTLKLGLIRDGHADYKGPYRSRPEVRSSEQRAPEENNQEIYDLKFSFAYIEFMNEEMPARTMRLYVGDFDDSDDEYLVSREEIDWSNPEELEVNRLCIEKFTCFICFEYIRREARFCERKHFICSECFDELKKRRRLRCPMCKADYAYDCRDEQIEELLLMVKFPDQDDGEADQEGPEDEEAKNNGAEKYSRGQREPEASTSKRARVR